MPLTYVAWRAGKTYRVVVPIRQAGNRFLGSLKGLQIRAQGYVFIQCVTRGGMGSGCVETGDHLEDLYTVYLTRF
jgi:hypothetical protein